MEDTYISFELALKLKQKGFDPRALLMKNVLYKDGVAFITLSLLQKWFREIHNIDVSILSYGMLGNNKCYEAVIGDGTRTLSGYATYERALEFGLLETLNLI